MPELFNTAIGMGIFESITPIITDLEKKQIKAVSSQDPSKEKGIYNTPLRIVSDFFPAFDIQEGDALTYPELFQKIFSFTGIPYSLKNSFSLLALSNDVYYISPKPSYAVKKGTSGVSLFLGQIQDLDSIIEGEKGADICASQVIKYIYDTRHMDITLYLVGDLYIPIPYKKSNGSLNRLYFPFRVYTLLSEEYLEISEEDYKNFSSELANRNVTDETGKNEINEKNMESILKTLFPDFGDNLTFAVNEKENFIQIMHKSPVQNTAPKKAEKEAYPSDATISLIFTKIPLSPMLFNGKAQVTEKEIIRYLGRQYPEYSAERTELRYDKKQNLIIPILKSGKRGALGYQLQDLPDYRKENSPIMSVLAYRMARNKMGCVDGTFEFYLPKIPFSILYEITHFFWDVYVVYHTEAIAEIFYSPEEKRYFIHIPEQITASEYVDFTRNIELEYDSSNYLVMEIHSHGSYPAFWSSTDNMEELPHRLYAVLGDFSYFQYDTSHIMVRAATGGLHVQVSPADVFTFPQTLHEYHPHLEKVKKSFMFSI